VPKVNARERANDPSTAYARDVVAGRVVAGKYVKQACKRHLADIDNAHSRGYAWQPEKAKLIFEFFGLLRHYKGKWAGQAFALEPWQLFALGLLWGWRRKDGTRRFRVFHLEVARKNGKSTLAAGIAIALLVLDGEPGAEVYCCATKKDQARITFNDAREMVQASTSLKRLIEPNKDNLAVLSSRSKLEPLAADGGKLDGLNVHAGICDELHAWKQRLLWDVIETATGARSQPLLVVTTTAGHDRHSIWWELREKAIKVLEGTFEDDELLGLIYTLDDGDRWDDEACWAKANPNLGVSIQADELRKRCEEAKQTPGKQNPFRRLRLNQPTEQADRWLDLDEWDACADPVDEDSLRGRTCVGALDLAQSLDLAAWVLVFEPTDEDPRTRLLCRFFLPEKRVQKRFLRDRVPYDRWAADGLITLTDGNVIDYDTIEARVKSDAEKFVIREVAFDRMFALQIIQHLQAEGLECVAFGQGFLSMAAPTKRLAEMIVSRELAHQGDPLLRWQAGNVAVCTDPAGNQKPDKRSSTEKIDGIVAAVMGIGRLIATSEEVEDAGMEVWS
jgi:phage terminase large subunit-like protein